MILWATDLGRAQLGQSYALHGFEMALLKYLALGPDRRLGSSWSPLPLMWQLSAPRTSVLRGLGRSCKASYDLASEVLKLPPYSIDHENQLIEGEGN